MLFKIGQLLGLQILHDQMRLLVITHLICPFIKHGVTGKEGRRGW